jgi:DNA-binding MarR family transcriptional regulator
LAATVAPTETAPPAPTEEASVAAWRSILRLVGWGGGGEAPRFVTVALELDLSPKQLGMLAQLDPEDDGIPMGEVAHSLYCDASYVTDMVDRLEERGLIERRADPEDRRVRRLALTPAGEELRQRALAALHRPPEGFERLTPPERETLAGLLAKVTAGA